MLFMSDNSLQMDDGNQSIDLTSTRGAGGSVALLEVWDEDEGEVTVWLSRDNALAMQVWLDKLLSEEE
jgi:hypothetical protein